MYIYSYGRVVIIVQYLVINELCCCVLQARNIEQKRLWCQQLKKSIIDNYEVVIPDKAKQLVMSLGTDSVVEGQLLGTGLAIQY